MAHEELSGMAPSNRVRVVVDGENIPVTRVGNVFEVEGEPLEGNALGPRDMQVLGKMAHMGASEIATMSGDASSSTGESS